MAEVVQSLPPNLLREKNKRKRKKTVAKSILDTDCVSKKRRSVNENPQPEIEEDVSEQKSKTELTTLEEIEEKYPILKNKELVTKFLAVTMTNNQKGRIRQSLRDNLKSSSSELDPEVISNRITMILSTSENLTDSDLRKIRILHNMLKVAAEKLSTQSETEKKGRKKKNKKAKSENFVTEESKTKSEKVVTEDSKAKSEKVVAEDSKTEEAENVTTEKTEKVMENVPSKVKGPKRYVVFVGNLPYDIDKDAIMRHFSDLVGSIKDVRIPKRGENKKGGMAYLELKDETSYQMALSKHHSMLSNRRINVLYTTTGKSKIDKSEAKGKTAKLLALQKSGKLLGSAPLNRKRSARRKKQREALAKEESGN